MTRVLVIDDESDIRELIDLTLIRMGLTASCVGTVSEAKAALDAGHFQLCLTDMRLPDGDGLDIVRYINDQHCQTPVAVITAFGSAENAVAALKAGAFDYLAKPVGLDQLRALVKSALRLPDSDIPGDDGLSALVGESPGMQQVRAMIEKLARSQAPVYISGESGSGKELAARLIHSRSARGEGGFVPVNCGAIPENLMESEFFGYRKGAFTGAVLLVASSLFEDWEFNINTELVLALLWSVFILSIAAVMLMMLLISRHSAARVSSLFFLTPALSAIESAILFGERLSPLALVALVVALTGVWLTMRNPVVAPSPESLLAE